MKNRKERFKEIKDSLVRLFNPSKWTKEEKKELKGLVLLTILIACAFFYAGRSFECHNQGGILGSYKDDSFETKYIIPECKFNVTLDEPVTSKFRIYNTTKNG